MVGKDTYDTRKIIRISILYIFIIILLLFVQAYFSNGIQEALDTGKKGMIIFALVGVIYFLPINPYPPGMPAGRSHWRCRK